MENGCYTYYPAGNERASPPQTLGNVTTSAIMLDNVKTGNDMAEAAHRSNLTRLENQEKHYFRLQELKYQADLEENLIKKRKEAAFDLQNATQTVFCGPDKKIHVQVKTPDGLSKSYLLFDVVDLRVTILKGYRPSGKEEEFYEFDWLGCIKKIIIPEEDASGKRIKDELIKAGITFSPPRMKIPDLLDAFKSFLLSRASQRILAYGFGWRQRQEDGSWYFCNKSNFVKEEEDEKTFIGLKNLHN